VQAILACAADAGIDTLDTAIAYGESEACLGRVGVTNWKVITKLPPLPANVTDVAGWIRAEIEGSLHRLGVPKLDAVLLHRASDLLGVHGAAYVRSLEQLKRADLADSVGVSIYDPAELAALWPIWRPDIVQAPFNVLDRRLLHSAWMERMVREGIRVHARSVFLQGLLLMAADGRPAWFAPWSDLLDRWDSWCREHGVSPLQCALVFARSQRDIECLVVGVDSVVHLKEIIAAASTAAPAPPPDLFSEELDLIDPSRWKVR
jgi:hypothetical protein